MFSLSYDIEYCVMKSEQNIDCYAMQYDTFLSEFCLNDLYIYFS